MNTELITVLEYLEHERGIDRETLMEVVEESLVAAAHRVLNSVQDLRVKIDRKTGDIQAWAKLTVVEEVFDREKEVSLFQARGQNPDIEVGEMIDWEVTPANFGRIAAQTAKQTIMHRLRQAEKVNICAEYESRLNQLVTGVVRKVERGEVTIDCSRAEGLMRYNDKIPGEEYQAGDHITALLVEIVSDRPGPSLFVSRSNPTLVKCLFEREVTEIAENLVEIKTVAREAGYRTKIAVVSKDSRVDPVGACVGLRGNRVKTVVRELGGEKVDIIRWDADIHTFVANALQPAKLSNVDVDEPRHTIKVTVPEDQLSLAIGKKGQNARLAAKLTGWRIDINKHEQPEKLGFKDKIQRAVEALAKIPGIGPDAAAKLVSHGFLSLEGILAADKEDIAAIEGFDKASAQKIIVAAREQMGE